VFAHFELFIYSAVKDSSKLTKFVRLLVRYAYFDSWRLNENEIPAGRNAQHGACVFEISLANIDEINKKSA